MGTYPRKLEGANEWVIWQSCSEAFFSPTFRNEAFAQRVADYWTKWASRDLIEAGKDVETLSQSQEAVSKQIKAEIGFDLDTDCPIDDKDCQCHSCEYLVLDKGDNFRCDSYNYPEEEEKHIPMNEQTAGTASDRMADLKLSINKLNKKGV